MTIINENVQKQGVESPILNYMYDLEYADGVFCKILRQLWMMI